MAVMEQEDRLKALRDAKLDPDGAILAGPPPDIRLTRPEPEIYQAWLERERTGRYFDSDLPPEYQDAELRQNVDDYAHYWAYMRAYLKRGT